MTSLLKVVAVEKALKEFREQADKLDKTTSIVELDQLSSDMMLKFKEITMRAKDVARDIAPAVAEKRTELNNAAGKRAVEALKKRLAETEAKPEVETEVEAEAKPEVETEAKPAAKKKTKKASK